MQNPRSVKIRSIIQLMVLSGLILSSFVNSGQAASTDDTVTEFPSKPVLRLETGMHSSRIKRIDVDNEERYLASCSLDKTVRIWDMKNGRLLRTLRMPLGDGNVGNVYSVAISPNKNHVAVGGWTVYKGNTENIYVFSLDSGEIVQVIRGLPFRVFHLSYSTDGKYLAATLGESHGLRIYESKKYRQIAEDRLYAKASYWADFNSSGNLVTTSEDGHIRLYDADFTLIHEKRAPGGKYPFSAVFSPDGKHIAVGYVDSNRVDVLSTVDLSLAYSADTKDVKNGSLLSVAWSDDGRFLYAAGTYESAGKTLVRRWSDGGLGDFTDFSVGFSGTVMCFKSLSKGRMAIGASDPFVAVLSKDVKPIWQNSSQVPNFNGQIGENGIRVSEHGDTVQFYYDLESNLPIRFSLKTWQLVINPLEGDPLSGPITETQSIKITDWKNEEKPKLNGKLLAIKEHEMSRSLAISQDQKNFLLGTEWRLRLFDQKGNEIWNVDSPDIAWSVNISRDDKLAVACFGDGTIRWYRMEDGMELLAFFPHKDSERWIAWTPQGFYQASAGGEDLIGWHLNNGSSKLPDFYGASRFRDQFYRPDIVQRLLDTLDLKTAVILADKVRGVDTVLEDITDILPPTVRIISPPLGTEGHTEDMTINYLAESSKGNITDVETRVNSRSAIVLKHRSRNYIEGDKLIIEGEINIRIPPKDVIISLIAKNKYGYSEPAILPIRWAGLDDNFRPNLYVLSIGANKYIYKHLNLKYAAKDAQDFAEEIKRQEYEAGLYSNVTVHLLDDLATHSATRDKILDELNWLSRSTGPRDIAMVFIAGHGCNDELGKYNFIPKDFDFKRATIKAIHDYEFKYYMSLIKGTTVLFLDTCRSGNVIQGGKDSVKIADIVKFANELSDASNGVIVFCSSSGRQVSLEGDEWNNGVFTKALIEGISSQAADFHQDWHVSTAELQEYLHDRVASLTNRKQIPVVAIPCAMPVLKIIRLRQ